MPSSPELLVMRLSVEHVITEYLSYSLWPKQWDYWIKRKTLTTRSSCFNGGAMG